MELSAYTLGLLRDEAYVALCREALNERLAALAQEKAEIASTRPPFGGVLARRETRDAFTRSMRSAEGNEAAVRDRLAQLERLDGWLQPAIRVEVAAYLVAASADYRHFASIGVLLTHWETACGPLPELMQAFARDLKAVREEAAAGAVAGQGHLQSLAVLREAAQRLELQFDHLARLAAEVQSLVHTSADLVRDVRLPTLPDLRRVAWVSRLALMPVEQCLAETARVEQLVREFIASGQALTLARIDASRSACASLAERFLQHYWNQLRAHAQIHYVEERDIDEVMDELAQRYVGADLIRQQRALTHDPFVMER
jgi:hypothetical protein